MEDYVKFTNSVCFYLIGLEVPAHKMPKFPGRLRLNRLKHLARTINDPRDEPVDDHRITTDSMAKMDVSPNCKMILLGF